MAMPTSGTLYLCNSDYEGVCRSIAHAVYVGNPPSSVSLVAMGDMAGIQSPIEMTDFYGYAPTAPSTWNFTIVYGSGIDSVNGDVRLQNSFGTTVETISVNSSNTGGIFLPVSGLHRVSYSLQAYSGRNSVAADVSWVYSPSGSNGSTGLVGSAEYNNTAQSVTITVTQTKFKEK
ncbi:MAG: hypothetical protein ACOCZ5_00285 [bacterium]